MEIRMAESSFLRQVAVATAVWVVVLTLFPRETHIHHFHGPPQTRVVQPIEVSIDWKAYALSQECMPEIRDGNFISQNGC